MKSQTQSKREHEIDASKGGDVSEGFPAPGLYPTTLGVDLGLEFVDLGSENSDHILSGLAADFICGFVCQVGVHVNAAQGSEERPARFSGGRG